MLVPLEGASAGRDYLRVAFSAEQVKATSGVESAETLSPDALARVRDAYGVDLAGGVALEAATLLERRRSEAGAATERADDPERTALAAADAAKEARTRAEEATRAADDAERAAVDAQAEATAAREAAGAARRNAGMTGSGDA